MKTIRLAVGTTVAAAVLMVCGAAVAEDWRYLMHKDAYAAGVDAASVRRDGDIARARLLTAPRGEASSGVLRVLMVMQIEIDCSSAWKRVVHRQAFMPRGAPLEAKPEPDAPWQPILPDTPVAALEAVLCDARPMHPRSSADLVDFGRWISDPAGSPS